MGGFDKFALLGPRRPSWPNSSKLEPVLADGGFIPHIDHRCPDGVSFDMYQYYIREKCPFLGLPQDEIDQIPGLAAD